MIQEKLKMKQSPTLLTGPSHYPIRPVFCFTFDKGASLQGGSESDSLHPELQTFFKMELQNDHIPPQNCWKLLCWLKPRNRQNWQRGHIFRIRAYCQLSLMSRLSGWICWDLSATTHRWRKWRERDSQSAQTFLLSLLLKMSFFWAC